MRYYVAIHVNVDDAENEDDAFRQAMKYLDDTNPDYWDATFETETENN